MNEEKVYFEVSDLLPVGLTLVVFGVAIAYGLNVQEDVDSDLGKTWCEGEGYTWQSNNDTCVNSTFSVQTVTASSYNASGDALEGVAKLPEKLPLVVTVIVAAVIIGILVRYLMVKFG